MQIRKVVFNLHLYTALVVGLVVAILGVTGSIMACQNRVVVNQHHASRHGFRKQRSIPHADAGHQAIGGRVPDQILQ